MKREDMTREQKEELFRDGAACVRHMCRALIEVYEFWPKAIHIGNESIVDYKIEQVGSLMNTLGDILNGMDAVTQDDDFTDQVFERLSKYDGTWDETHGDESEDEE